MTGQLHWTFSVNPRAMGTYHRRLADISKALTCFETEKLPPNSAAQFVGYYFGCEKLAKGIVGIDQTVAAGSAYKKDINAAKIASAAAKLKLAISGSELASLFATVAKSNKTPTVARAIRDRLFHDFGPTNVSHAVKHAPTLIPIMIKFLNCETQVQAHLRSLGASYQVENPPAHALKK
jgi:hypothetical protein